MEAVTSMSDGWDHTDGPLATPTRIAFAGDWHANTHYATAAIDWAAVHGAQVILHTGDFGYGLSGLFLARLPNALLARHMRLLFVDGNHEHHDALNRMPLDDHGLRPVAPLIWHLPRGYRWTWAGVRFLALGGAHSVDRRHRVPGVSWWPQETLTTTDAATAVAGGRADVMVCHDAPAGVDIPGLNPRMWPEGEVRAANNHRELLATVVSAVQPRWLWHGHYHRRYTAKGPPPVDCRVEGLDCDGVDLNDNIQVVDLADLR
jgi:predicted phosphodiesterase